MAHHKLRLAALMSACTLAGIAGGALGASWLFFHVYGNTGDFAAGRAIDVSRLFVDGSGHSSSQADVYRNALRSMRQKTVEAGLAFGSMENPNYPMMLRRALARLSEYPGLYTDDGADDSGNLDLAIYSAGTANAVRACIMQERAGTPEQAGRQVSDCAAKAVRQVAQAQTTAAPPSNSPTIPDAASQVPEATAD